MRERKRKKGEFKITEAKGKCGSARKQKKGAGEREKRGGKRGDAKR